MPTESYFISGAPGRTRTTGTWFRKPPLYPPELQTQSLKQKQFYDILFIKKNQLNPYLSNHPQTLFKH